MDNVIGRKVRTLYQYSETGTILRKHKTFQGLEDWYVIKFDAGGKGSIHRTMFVLANE